MNGFYAVYKGDKFICEGTRDEICDFLNIKVATFNYYRTKHWIVNRDRGTNNRIVILRLDKEDRMHPECNLHDN